MEKWLSNLPLEGWMSGTKRKKISKQIPFDEVD